MKNKATYLSLVLAVLVAAVLVLSGCGSLPTPEEYPLDNFSDEWESEEAWTDGKEAPIAEYDYGESSFLGDFDPSRKIITNTFIEINSWLFDDDVATLRQAAKKSGGYAGQSSIYGGKNDTDRSAYFVFYIPVDHSEDFIETAMKTGELISFSENKTDVTSESVDIDARLALLKSQEEQLNELMTQANTIEETILIQEMLMSTQQDIENYTAFKDGLIKQVEYVAVSVSIFEATSFFASGSPYSPGWYTPDGWYGPSGSYTDPYFIIARVLLIFLIPFVTAGLTVLVLYLIYRSKNKNKPQDTKSTVAFSMPPLPPHWVEAQQLQVEQQQAAIDQAEAAKKTDDTPPEQL